MLHGIMQKCNNKRKEERKSEANKKNNNQPNYYYFIENDFICRFAKRINWMRDKHKSNQMIFK